MNHAVYKFLGSRVNFGMNSNLLPNFLVSLMNILWFDRQRDETIDIDDSNQLRIMMALQSIN